MVFVFYKYISIVRVDQQRLHSFSGFKNAVSIFQVTCSQHYYKKKSLISSDIPAQSEPTGLDLNYGRDQPDGATIVS